MPPMIERLPAMGEDRMQSNLFRALLNARRV